MKLVSMLFAVFAVVAAHTHAQTSCPCIFGEARECASTVLAGTGPQGDRCTTEVNPCVPCYCDPEGPYTCEIVSGSGYQFTTGARCELVEKSVVHCPADPCAGVVCEGGFAPDETNSCECTKKCANDNDCVLEGVCSGQCLSTGFCEDGTMADTCPRKCCKATPGNVPGVLRDAICSNGCGQNSCCFETAIDACNNMPSASEMVEACTALYGADRPCESDVDCGPGGTCLDVQLGGLRANLCSAQCDDASPCPTGYTCLLFTESYSPPLSFCVQDLFSP